MQYIYFNAGKLELTLEETQFNLAMIAANVGSSIVTGASIWEEENVTLGAGGTGTVSGTPLVTPGATGTIYGWVSYNGTTERVTFTGSNFTATGGTNGQVVCVRYYKANAAARQVTVPANIIPANIRLVMDCQLASSDTSDISGASIIGRTQFEIGSAQLSGAQEISMTSNGVSNTPLKAMALADTTSVAGCTGAGIYGKITQIINSANWYDTVSVLAVTPPTATITSGSPTQQLTVWAIPSVGVAFQPPITDITFVSSTPATATVSSSGLVTRVAAGTTTITATITNKNTVKDVANITAS